MKVAIMGAGLSGLTCAIMLERHGIKPTIFESRTQVGDRFINGEAFLSLLTRPINDSFQYLSDEYQLYLRPTGSINQIIINSENEQASIKEHVGFVNIRGRHKLSLEAQLAEQVKSDILFNSKHSYEELLQEYSHVIMATGDAEYAMKLQNFREDLSVSLKGATIEGNFDRFSVLVWLDNTMAPKGYGYLLPFSDTEANIVIAHPDLQEGQEELVTKFWERFYDRVCSELGQTLRITDQFQIHNYKLGICKSARIGNTFFTGNCFGSAMPFLGFGQFAAILTGIYAAYDLCGYGKYEDYTKILKKSYDYSLTLRRGMEHLTNQNFDFIVKHLNGYVGDKLFRPSKHNPLKTLSYLVRPFIKKER
ncbi:NAD(P)/FAD-dependent oxidoreductase [Anaerobacillus sp. CMMVII]|uniref:NAD(P)/FAD-dependent oxidoreductase n=1 Tax=Anaerobacillus sp. CMMVII TaxID=2755588 RepID=UPI0021B740A0|nr:NAD(P)/FAD-dependent oxidoreductase [Anaerobacillus sp. CMMVII]MCT8139419.1 NAD(P)/FAD-dependent oxidoreductase [Anaerobacillus sp. CMMVII]